MRTLQRLALLIATLWMFSIAFLAFVRPWYMHWGTIAAERSRPLPGDQIIPETTVDGQETRAITINAPIDRVWPWVAQIGQDRAGFYSWKRLEDLVGCEMPSSDRLHPELGHWQLGDKLWMYPADKVGGAGHATLRVLVPGRALGFATRRFGTSLTAPEDGSWSFVLEPIDASTTRMLIRGRGAPGRSLLGVAFDRSVFEPIHFMMERRMLIGLKESAEGDPPSALLDDIQISLWVITFASCIAAAVMVVRRERWKRPLIGFIGGVTLFQYLTLGQPPVGIGVQLVAILVAWLWWPLPADDARQGGEPAIAAKPPTPT